MKIQIIGYSGSGKSTLAKNLSQIFNLSSPLPILYLDKIAFYENEDWKKCKDEEMTEKLKKFLKENKNHWIIDGNYTRIVPRKFICLFSAIRRYFHHKWIPRESSNCPDKLSKEFIWWLVYEGRTQDKHKRHLNNLNKTQGQKIILNSRSEIKNFLDQLKKTITTTTTTIATATATASSSITATTTPTTKKYL
ncbi:hypothetical protein BCR32DRAFT_305759 [Anaeromyces robustus]|uniref:P-loop containing nucleoside triphosphate hydrolase protein n=1 Tax=Anaeromyces robustus TaxID=1754192 RepID=A0A1Y1XGP2_9FUNG|nr:hypothetical protein BCR32DRAFT_305759 [Anaeromyces robustus]|eukprot:ORX84929.1 hypothetical protein BCR32DRAFT_305759 [Anaeromyces robustus]